MIGDSGITRPSVRHQSPRKRAKRRAWRLSHPEEALAQDATWLAAHPEIAAIVEWREAHPEEARAWDERKRRARRGES